MSLTHWSRSGSSTRMKRKSDACFAGTYSIGASCVSCVSNLQPTTPHWSFSHTRILHLSHVLSFHRREHGEQRAREKVKRLAEKEKRKKENRARREREKARRAQERAERRRATESKPVEREPEADALQSLVLEQTAADDEQSLPSSEESELHKDMTDDDLSLTSTLSLDISTLSKKRCAQCVIVVCPSCFCLSSRSLSLSLFDGCWDPCCRLFHGACDSAVATGAAALLCSPPLPLS
jgi:hypothetical protein